MDVQKHSSKILLQIYGHLSHDAVQHSTQALRTLHHCTNMAMQRSHIHAALHLLAH